MNDSAQAGISAAGFQEQFKKFVNRFGALSGVHPDGALVIQNLSASDAVDTDWQDLDQQGARDLMQQALAFTEDEDAAMAKTFYIGQLFAAYVMQRCLVQNPDIAAPDAIGTPVDALPMMPGLSPAPLAQFSFFKTSDAQEQAVYIQQAIEAVYQDAQNDEVLARGADCFDAFVEQVAQQQAAQLKREVNPDEVRFELLQANAIFSRMTKDQIFEESLTLLNEGADLREGGPLARLQQAVAKIEALPKAFAQNDNVMFANGQRLDFEISPVRVIDGGNALMAVDRIGKKIVSLTRDDLLDVLAKKQNPNLATLVSGLVVLEAYGKARPAEAPYGDIIEVALDQEYNIEQVHVAYDAPEDLPKRLRSMKAGDQGYPFPETFNVPHLNAQAQPVMTVSPLAKKDVKAMASSAYVKADIMPSLLEACKGNQIQTMRLNTYTEAVLDQPQMGGYIADMIKTCMTKGLRKEHVEALRQDHAQDDVFTKVLAQMDDLAAAHAERLEQRDQANYEYQKQMDATLARGTNAEKAYSIWQEIYALPKPRQAAAQLRAFCPAVAGDVPADATTSGERHDYIELGLESWTQGRMKAVREELGALTPKEEALMHYTLAAAKDSMRYIIMMELAAYDPTLFMRKERDIYYKHLDQAKDIYKDNGGVEPLQNLETHVSDWRGENYHREDSGPTENLVDIVEYRTEAQGEHSSYHHYYTQFYCYSDFFLNAAGQAKSNVLDRLGLSALANRMMAADSPHRLTREIAQAILNNDADELLNGTDQSRFERLLSLSTEVANRPAETAELHQGKSLLTGAYVLKAMEAKQARRDLEKKALQKLANG